ncbi:MAG TPA: anhydro-N-acetylmuramic acid kinase [Bacteroidales bacterium]|nr:anhydro-N-acetylmuramic acid kinase [Bacteroidales bacterium]
MKSYKVVGVMSGTSLDGLDIALCEFSKNSHNWNGKILKADTIAYSQQWRERLDNANQLSGYELIKLDTEFGHFIGTEIKKFLSKKKGKADFISSHGHTVYHQPAEKITFQLGNGAAIAAAASLTTISNFRVLDVALHGQGAPLVPIGDQMLFSDYDYCLNLGGFANVSYSWYKKRIAYDVCPVNIVINRLAQQLGHEYDKDGELARQGKINDALLKELNKIDYYNTPAPKSLGREWVDDVFNGVLAKHKCSITDQLRTIYEHIAFQMYRVFSGTASKKILLTGGGTHNKFLVELIGNRIEYKLAIPEKEIIDFKEAYIFAFLGVLRMRQEYNCLSSVTGARHDNVGGNIFII